MKPAPTKTQTARHFATPLTLAPVSNPALERMQSAFAQQTRELDAAFSSLSELSDMPFALGRELLDEIELACTTRPAARGALLSLSRC